MLYNMKVCPEDRQIVKITENPCRTCVQKGIIERENMEEQEKWHTNILILGY